MVSNQSEMRRVLGWPPARLALLGMVGGWLAVGVAAVIGTATLAAGPGGAGKSGGEAIGCPAAIDARQVATAPAGWELSYEAGPNRLTAVTFFEGPPAERGSLVYDEEVRGAKETRAVWKLAASGKGTWISCGYDGTRALLSRRLPAAVRVCTVRYETGVSSAAGLPAILGIECR